MRNYTTLLSSRQSARQLQHATEAFATNWIAPVGPHVNAFEEEFAELVGVPHAAALSSGTAALHLALLLAGVGIGDEVLVSTLTFSASVNPIVYLGAKPLFIDSECCSWNMDPALLVETLARKARQGKLPKAVVLVHLYGQSADIEPIQVACEQHGIALIEDAAEALGSRYHSRTPGTFGKAGIYSFNGNKIITTMLERKHSMAYSPGRSTLHLSGQSADIKAPVLPVNDTVWRSLRTRPQHWAAAIPAKHSKQDR